MQLPYCDVVPALTCSVWEMIGRSLSILWMDWPKDMQISSFNQGGAFILNGTCPHCGKEAAFAPVTQAYEERRGNYPYRMAEVAKCIACNDYILAIARYEQYTSSTGYFVYDAHYPLGKPNDAVAEEIPPSIKPDFKEALRCRFVDAYNATVEMCRRALEASCEEQGAAAKLVLNDKIDWVHDQGKITTPLKDMAHTIKLGGNRGAHPSDKTLTKEDADAVIEFTREYFHHVYVMPAKMAKVNFEKPKTKP